MLPLNCFQVDLCIFTASKPVLFVMLFPRQLCVRIESSLF